jgi:serine/threonine protein kinase
VTDAVWSDARIIAGRYRLDRPIGRGGMGEVWAGYDTRLDRRIAVKLLKQPSVDSLAYTDARDEAENRRQRFLREVRATAELTIPGIPAVHDTGVDEPTNELYLVMQLLDGAELGVIIDETDWTAEPLPVSWAAAIGAQIAAVLVEVHQRSIVHRDIKPRNLYLTPGGIVKVLDFGVAALLRGDETTRLTRIGQTVGTPPYMAPEQILASTVGPAADVYGLGCVLHEVLTGRPPFTDGGGMSVQEHHVRTLPTPVRTLRPEIPAAFDALVQATLAKTAEQRPTAEQVYETLLPLTRPAGKVTGRDDINPCLPFDRPMAAASMARRPRPRPSLDVGEPPLSSADADAVRHLAVQLVEANQLTRAVDALDDAIGRGGEDHVMLDLRHVLAATLVLAGSYGRAVTEYDQAAAGYARLYGSDDDDALDCRYQAAVCRAQTGEHSAALDDLQTFLQDWQRVKGADNERALDARRQIGVLLTSLSRYREAHDAFASLRDDLIRTVGPDSEAVAAIEDQLARLDKYDTGV